MTEPLSIPTGSAATPASSGVDLRDPAVLFSLLIAGLIGTYLLLTSTKNLIPGIWPYDGKRILQFALLFVLFLVPALNGKIRQEFVNLVSASPVWIKLTLLAMFAWGLLSVIINAQTVMHGLNSFSEVALLSALVIGIFVVAACRRIAGRSFDRLAVGLLAVTGLAVGFQELIGVLAAHNAGVDFNFRVSLLHFSWPRFYNQVQTWMVPVLAALPLLFARHRLALVLCALVLGLQWYIILMTGARGSFVSLCAAIALALVFLPNIRVRLVTWQAAGFAIGALVFALVAFSFEEADATGDSLNQPGSSQPSVMRDADRDASSGQISDRESSFFKQSIGRPMVHTSGRTWIWRATLEDARKHPLIGIGPMNYVCTSEKRIGHPHNFLLQLAAEWGAPVAIAFCLLSGLIIWRTACRIRKKGFGGTDDNTLAGLLLTGVLAASFHACLSGVLVMPASQVTGLLLSGMLLGLCPVNHAVRIKYTSWRGTLSGLVLSLFLLGLGTHELHTMKTRSELLAPGASMWPRIWQDAKVCQSYQEQIEVNN